MNKKYKSLCIKVKYKNDEGDFVINSSFSGGNVNYHTLLDAMVKEIKAVYGNLEILEIIKLD